MELLVTDFRDYLIKTYGLHPETFSIYSNSGPTTLKRYFDASFLDHYSLMDILVPDVEHHSQEECFRLMAHQIKFELIRTIIDKENDLYNTLQIMFNVKRVKDGYLVSDKQDGNEKLVNSGYDAFGVLTPKLLFNPDRIMLDIYRGLVIINTNDTDYSHIETKVHELSPDRIDVEVFAVTYNKRNETYKKINKVASRLTTSAEEGIFIKDDTHVKRIFPNQHPIWMQQIKDLFNLYESPVNTFLSATIPLMKSKDLYYGNNLYVNTPDCVFIFMENTWIPTNLEWLLNNEQAVPERIRNELVIYKNIVGTANA